MVDLTAQIAKLLPIGEAWIAGASSNIYKTIALFSNALQRTFNYSDYAQQDVFPVSAQDSVDVWQKSVSLPDPLCPPLTKAQLKTQMVSRVKNLGGQSKQYYIDYAAFLGYTITITELAVPRSGLAKSGQSATNGPGGDFIWCVSVPSAVLSLFRAGKNRAGDPLSSASDTLWLQYEMNRIKSSQTILEWFV
jgi:uncharacterized protein YmfQ (DUF2313 family)